MNDDLREWLAERAEGALTMNGFDDAIVGVAERCGKPALVVYDRDKCIGVLLDRDGMDREEADEFFSFNCEGAWVGEGTPLILTKVPEELRS